MSSERADLALDADVLMNLLATDRLEEILVASGARGILCPRTRAESIYLNPRSPSDPRETIDLSPHIDSGILVEASLDEDETATFIRFAAEVDDGEAQVLAVGLHRGLIVATDDRRARNVAAREGIGLLSTPELILAWAVRAGRRSDEHRQAITDIEIRARFRPRPGDPSRSEWDRLRNE
jgi:hypothetical protein